MDDNSIVDARYAAPVLDTVKIRARRLVVVDRGAHPPEIVYRVAHVGEVVRAEGGRIAVVRHNAAGEVMGEGDARVHVVTPAEGLDVAAGDAVFFTGGAEGTAGRLVDVIVGGGPSRPERLRADVFPRVEELYAKLA